MKLDLFAYAATPKCTEIKSTQQEEPKTCEDSSKTKRRLEDFTIVPMLDSNNNPLIQKLSLSQIKLSYFHGNIIFTISTSEIIHGIWGIKTQKIIVKFFSLNGK